MLKVYDRSLRIIWPHAWTRQAGAGVYQAEHESDRDQMLTSDVLASSCPPASAALSSSSDAVSQPDASSSRYSSSSVCMPSAAVRLCGNTGTLNGSQHAHQHLMVSSTSVRCLDGG